MKLNILILLFTFSLTSVTVFAENEMEREKQSRDINANYLKYDRGLFAKDFKKDNRKKTSFDSKKTNNRKEHLLPRKKGEIILAK